MKFLDYVILILVVLWLAAAIRSMIRKKGGCCCGGDCGDSCSACKAGESCPVENISQCTCDDQMKGCKNRK